MTCDNVRTECELLNKACVLPSLIAASNETGGSGRPDRSASNWFIHLTLPATMGENFAKF